MSLQYNNANLPTSFWLNTFHSKLKRPIKSATLKGNPFYQLTSTHIYQHLKIQIMKKTANIWGYNVGNNANIANFVRLWKCWVVYVMVSLCVHNGCYVSGIDHPHLFLCFSFTYSWFNQPTPQSTESNEIALLTMKLPYLQSQWALFLRKEKWKPCTFWDELNSVLSQTEKQPYSVLWKIDVSSFYWHNGHKDRIFSVIIPNNVTCNKLLNIVGCQLIWFSFCI